jgi:CDP-2,3-bis-(O-geranylgeranyl)-sn-glycerol synthase
MVLTLIFQALWFIFPAYAANAAPILIKGRRPIDFGLKLGKYRLLGDGKTIEGAVGGIVIGTVAGWLQMNHYATEGFVRFTLPLIFLLSAGAIIGDIAGAFIKRRLGIPRGYPAPLLDQLDFLAGALALSSLAVKLEAATVAALVILTPIIHLAANRISYLLKIKRVPY